MAGFSFSQNGSTPNGGNSFLSGYLGGNPGTNSLASSPYSRALNSAASPAPNMSTNAGPRYAAPPVTAPLSFASPSTPVKKQTVTNTDGSTHTTEYHEQATPGLLTASQGAPTDPAGGGGHAVIPTGSAQTNQQTGGNAVIPTGGTSGTPSTISDTTQPTTPQSQVQQGPTTFPGLVGSLANFNPYSNPLTSSGVQDAGLLRSQLRSSIKNETNDRNENRLNPIPLSTQTGRDAAIRANYEGQQAQLANTLGYDTSVINSGLTGSGQQYSALNSATGLSQPQIGQYGQTYYSPLSGGAIQPTPQQYTIKPGDTFYNLAGGDQNKVTAIEAANPGVDPNNLQPGQQIKMPAAQQGTPFTAGQVQGDQALGQQYAQNVSAVNQAKAIKGQIQSYISANPNLNPSVFTDINSLIQLMSGKVSSPQYQTLSNYLSEYVSTLAPILGVGGDTTNLKTQIAQGFVNAAQSGQSISTVLDGIEQLANAKLAAQAGGSNSTNASSVVSPSVTQSNPGSSTGGTASAGGYTFKQDSSGKWSYVPQ